MGLMLLAGGLTIPRVSWAPPLIKIGVVNWSQIVTQYEAYQSKLKSLEKKRERLLRYIEEEYGALKKRKLRRQLKKGSSMEKEVKKLYEKTLKQYKNRRQKTIESYHRKIKEAIRKEAIEQGYSLILSENEVLYAAEGYTDLTHDVIERLNQKKNGS